MHAVFENLLLDAYGTIRKVFELKIQYFHRPVFGKSRDFPLTLGQSIHFFVEHAENRLWIKTDGDSNCNSPNC